MKTTRKTTTTKWRKDRNVAWTTNNKGGNKTDANKSKRMKSNNRINNSKSSNKKKQK